MPSRLSAGSLWSAAADAAKAAAAAEQPAKAAPAQTKQPPGPGSYVLAISWQPAFCEGNPRKPECRSQTGARFDATHFTLHGLWPQPGTNIYCGVSGAKGRPQPGGRWSDLPRLRPQPPHPAPAVEQAMPGSQSFLDRYEWVKHGTCYPPPRRRAYYRSRLPPAGRHQFFDRAGTHGLQHRT